MVCPAAGSVPALGHGMAVPAPPRSRHRRGRGGSSGCLPWFALLLALGLVSAHPWLWAVAGGLAATAVILAVIRGRQQSQGAVKSAQKSPGQPGGRRDPAMILIGGLWAIAFLMVGLFVFLLVTR